MRGTKRTEMSAAEKSRDTELLAGSPVGRNAAGPNVRFALMSRRLTHTGQSGRAITERTLS